MIMLHTYNPEAKYFMVSVTEEIKRLKNTINVVIEAENLIHS